MRGWRSASRWSRTICLRLLRAARLLKAGRRGKQVFYSIPDCHVREMLTNMIEHLPEPHEQEDDINVETGVTP